MNDMGMMVLALLANDRYQAIVDPIRYKISEKHPVRRLVFVFVTAAVAIGMDLLGQALWLYANLNDTATRSFAYANYQMRAAYMFACLFM